MERTREHLVRDPPGDRCGLPRAGTRQDDYRAAHRFDGAPLLGVQPGEYLLLIHDESLRKRRDDEPALGRVSGPVPSR